MIGMKDLYSHRKETIERIFGTAKENHGFRYTQMYGKARMKMKVALTFACMNLKKLANCKQEWGLQMAQIKVRYAHLTPNYHKNKKEAPRNANFTEHFVYILRIPYFEGFFFVMGACPAKLGHTNRCKSDYGNHQ